ncbi:MAG: helix-turn-helix domain-containing protein [Ruminococcus sp.]|nr:helix-turn-helix domain-containing protein [Ruminococcus sp.]
MADKIIILRKKNGWSQEELAEKMGVSRQSVSKWEGAQSVPDLKKILQLAELFGVTTDYLLKDSIENEEYTQDDIADNNIRKVSLAQANEFLEQRKKAAKRIALATFMCIISPIALILFGAVSESGIINISEVFATVIGLLVLFIFAAFAVVLFVYTGMKNSPYEFLEKEIIETEYGVSGMVKEKQKQYHNTYIKSNILGTVICILSPVPLILGAFMDNSVILACMLSLTMVLAGIGATFFISAGVRWESMQKLLQEGEYSRNEKTGYNIKNAIDTVYWLLAVAVYLLWSFITNDWGLTWIVWPIAGVLYGAVSAVCDLFIKSK